MVAWIGFLFFSLLITGGESGVLETLKSTKQITEGDGDTVMSFSLKDVCEVDCRLDDELGYGSTLILNFLDRNTGLVPVDIKDEHKKDFAVISNGRDCFIILRTAASRHNNKSVNCKLIYSKFSFMTGSGLVYSCSNVRYKKILQTAIIVEKPETTTTAATTTKKLPPAIRDTTTQIPLVAYEDKTPSTTVYKQTSTGVTSTEHVVDQSSKRPDVISTGKDTSTKVSPTQNKENEASTQIAKTVPDLSKSLTGTVIPDREESSKPPNMMEKEANLSPKRDGIVNSKSTEDDQYKIAAIVVVVLVLIMLVVIFGYMLRYTRRSKSVDLTALATEIEKEGKSVEKVSEKNVIITQNAEIFKKEIIDELKNTLYEVPVYHIYSETEGPPVQVAKFAHLPDMPIYSNVDLEEKMAQLPDENVYDLPENLIEATYAVPDKSKKKGASEMMDIHTVE